MANEIRARANLVSGTLSVALSNVDVTMSSAGLANLPVIDTTNHATIIIENEIIYVTAHTASATTATILRAQEGTAAAAHNINVAWNHGEVASDFGEWISYTPTLVQSVTVTKTVTYAKYQRVGRLIKVQGVLTVTGAGTAANAIVIGLPITAQAGASVSFDIGTGSVNDASAGARYMGHAIFASTTSMYLLPSTGTANIAMGQAVMAAGLAVGDIVSFNVAYEAATF